MIPYPSSVQVRHDLASSIRAAELNYATPDGTAWHSPSFTCPIHPTFSLSSFSGTTMCLRNAMAVAPGVLAGTKITGELPKGLRLKSAWPYKQYF